MNDAAPQAKQQCFANLETLRRQLQELAATRKWAGSTDQGRRQEARGPVLVIRGK